jgi:hypothetical protein
MFITKKSLPRRTFLRGMGAVVGLPLLDAMVPAATALAQTAAKAPKRAGFVYVPNGVILESWIPATSGPGFEFSPTLKPLEPYRNQVTVVSRMDRPGDDPDHALASAGWLSNVTAKETEGQDFLAGTTVDQIIARQIGKDSPILSIEVATEDFTGYVGGCSPGYACAYVNTLSWSTPTTPLPMEINPRVVFERMFGRAGTSAQRLARLKANRGVLDSVADDLKQLERGLAARDRARLDEYFTHVREIETRIQRMESRQNSDIDVEAPVGIPATFEEHSELLFDLLAVAFQADLSRVFTFMMTREFSMKTYPAVGITEPHHAISHHGNKAAQIAKHATVNLHHMNQFAKFVERLNAMPDGDGTMLEHSMLFYGSGMGNGNVHSRLNVPMAVIGGGVKGDRHIQAPKGAPIGNFWIGIANKFGSPIDKLGESTGIIEI